MSSLFSRLLIGSLLCFTASSFAEETCLSDPEPYRMTLRHLESKGVGYDRGYTTLEVFLAPDPSRLSIMPFADIRGHVFDDGKWAANAGVGIRALRGCRIYGANIYYDHRHAKKEYNQIGLGFETLGDQWDFRVNGYLPVGSKRSSLYDLTTTSFSAFNSFQGHQALIKQTFTTQGKVQFAMKGINAEAAFHIFKNENFALSAALGPYYYNYGSKNAIGGQARVEARIGEYVTIEVINSYDSRFHENIQGSIGINIPFGPKSNSSKCNGYCPSFCSLEQKLLQKVKRQEIIVLDKMQKTRISEAISPAINPATGDPYFFVFVDNTSSSEGTYESPYPTLVLAQENSSPGDIIYVYPGDGTTTGMDSGIFLQANQKFWGSGLSHLLQTPEGAIAIPAQSSSAPIITNTNIDTEGNAITLATHNAIRGFTITSALNDAIYGVDPQSLDISSCTIENTTTFAVEALFSGDASISLTNNHFLNNVNGVFLNLEGTSSLVCSDNTFEGQTSISSIPLEISADSNTLEALIENNVFKDNTTGSIRFDLANVIDVDTSILNNTITNNGTGSQASLGSSITTLSSGTGESCSIVLRDNTFSGNASNALYLHTSGEFTNLEVTASANTISDVGGSAIVCATPSSSLIILATDNTITGIGDNGIAIIGSALTDTGSITINNNTITDVGNTSNGIAINQDFSTLKLTLLNNEIDRCEGTGIISYAPTGIDSVTLNIADNVISNCQNLSSNAAAGLDMEQYTNLEGSISNNVLSNNMTLGVLVGSNLPTPTACLNLTANNSDTGYLLTNPFDGTFNLTPCDVDTSNVGTISVAGVITRVQSCPDTTPCPPP